jgi:phage shock protein C
MNQKRLCRSRKNVLVAGVCAGLAEYFDHDPTLWRLGFALFLVITGVMPGVLLYIIAWIVMPVASETTFVDVTETSNTTDPS